MKRKIAYFMVAILLSALASAAYFSNSSSDGALIKDMRSASKSNPSRYQENLDEVALKHIPLGTPAKTALEICQKNGFKAAWNKNTNGADFAEFKEFIYCTREQAHWFLVLSEEYRVILYIKNGQVGAVIGRFFIHSI